VCALAKASANDGRYRIDSSRSGGDAGTSGPAQPLSRGALPILLTILVGLAQLPDAPGAPLLAEGARCAATGFCPIPTSVPAQGPLFLVSGVFLLLLAGWRSSGSSR